MVHPLGDLRPDRPAPEPRPLARPPPCDLFIVLEELRLDPQDPMVDERALTPTQRHVLDAAAAVLAAVV
ncbi:MAG: hypothetical protein K6U89_12650 [Chloroflexi bacterium]|nr:hypothetical protein [Chloroflexota bacterium]